MCVCVRALQFLLVFSFQFCLPTQISAGRESPCRPGTDPCLLFLSLVNIRSRKTSCILIFHTFPSEQIGAGDKNFSIQTLLGPESWVRIPLRSIWLSKCLFLDQNENGGSSPVPASECVCVVGGPGFRVYVE